YRDLGDVIIRMQKGGFNLSAYSARTWNDKPVYVIGATAGDLTSNQVWIDARTFYVLRIIEKLNATDQMDMRFETHQQWCKGFVETRVSFRRNGELEQVEEYYDIKKTDGFPDN